jgi:seryl-tRNA synthetase
MNAIQKTAANNPGAAIAAMFAAQRGSQGDIINLASQVNAQNADRATALNKANTQHQYNQLLMDKDASDVYNQRQATWASNKAQDYNNYWANVGDKFAKMKGNARTLAAVNQAQGMKWNIDPVTGEEYYVNTNNKAITPEKPAEDFATKMARFKAMGITDNSDVLKAMDLERKMNVTKFGGVAYKNGGYVYADILYPFIL